MKSLLVSFRVLVIMTILTGVAYPLIITGISGFFFPSEANGSIVFRNNQPIGSQLIGQSFDTTGKYFFSRPSSISYNPLPSGGSNFGLTSKKLHDQYHEASMRFRAENGLSDSTRIPSEMLFSSASGLDPDISPEAAFLQVDRVCRLRSFNGRQKTQLMEIIRKCTLTSQYFLFGESRVNVLKLNLELDKIK